LWSERLDNDILQENPMSRPIKNIDPAASKVFLIGGGIASLASAKYLIDDVGMPGENIHVL
jgi:myosin-crossreactive antigen